MKDTKTKNELHQPVKYIAIVFGTAFSMVLVTVVFLFAKQKGIGSKNTNSILAPTIQITNQKTYESCLTVAYKHFMTEWNASCKTKGVNGHQANCNLPKDLSDKLNQDWATAKNQCYK